MAGGGKQDPEVGGRVGGRWQGRAPRGFEAEPAGVSDGSDQGHEGTRELWGFRTRPCKGAGVQHAGSGCRPHVHAEI